ncbi:MAG: hypothetical protein R2737_07395 [Candidatus Nanopelagicales bacterium]
MTRMIERWFPCAEVSQSVEKGWGLGRAEKAVFPWFAARPPAQAKAAVICSLLPWPQDEQERKRLQDIVRRAMTGRYEASAEVRREILKANPGGASVLDPFSGRGILPLEAARLGLESVGIDYSPVAALASQLLCTYPFVDWSAEPSIQFADEAALASATGGATARNAQSMFESEPLGARLLRDVATVLAEVGRRQAKAMEHLYPASEGRLPWGYLWAVTIPCQECGRRFPLVGSYNLRLPSELKRRGTANREYDAGQSFYIDGDPATGSFRAVVHDGTPVRTPTLSSPLREGKRTRGKSAICPFPDCGHVHSLDTHQRLAGEGQGNDVLLVVAEVGDKQKWYREPTNAELAATGQAAKELGSCKPFSPILPAVPTEQIPLNNGATIRPSLYGAKTYGDLMCPRQTLSTVSLCQAIGDVAADLRRMGVSADYVDALAGYAAACVAKKIRYSTRGATLYVANQQVTDIYLNEGAIAFSYDFFETGIGEGAGTWGSVSANLISTLKNITSEIRGHPARISRASATNLPLADSSLTAVVTDPPYDSMVYYSDSSDLVYSWLKRALANTRPEMAITADARGLQEKTLEIIVKEHGKAPGEHRNREHYDRLISESFVEMRRVIPGDGLVTIVFGHGDPEVWQRLLAAIMSAGLVMTGSWPARTESGGQQGKANIETTLTMSCRPAAANRPDGMKASVEAEVRAEVMSRIELWEKSGLAPTDMLMASAGPAMEVVGRYERVLDIAGEPVDPTEYLVVARRAVQEDARIEIDHHPLDTFDARTRYALWWVQLFGKNETAKSEMRWQTLAADMDLAAVRDLMFETSKGVRFTDSAKFKGLIGHESAVIDVTLAMAGAWAEGMDAVGAVLAASGREDDPYLWAAVKFLSNRLPESDPDAIAWTKIIRNQSGVTASARGAAADAASVQESLDFSGGTGV